MISSPKKLLFGSLIIIFSIFVFWKIIFDSSSPILQFSYWLDDWPLIWGSSQRGNIFYNPNKIFWNFEDERFTVREGFIQIWVTSALYNLFGLNPYWYHFYGLLAKLVASMAILWSIYKLTSKLYLGILAGIIFASSVMGIESLYWYNVNSVYILIAVAAVALPFIIKGFGGDRKSYIISLVLTALGIFLYPPRAHVFLAFPLVALIWSGKIFSKKFLIKIFLLLAVIFIAYKIPTAGGAEGQAYRAIIHRLIVFSGDGLNAGNHMFFTYPLVSISLSVFPTQFLNDLANLPQELFFGAILRPKATFFVWNFIFFPILWIGLIMFLNIVKKIFKENINLKRTLSWASTGICFLIINEVLRITFLQGQYWDRTTHFLFTLSVFLILFSAASFDLLKKNSDFNILSKILLSSVVLILVSYIFNWAFDPLIHPASLSISRYLTLPTAFGSIFLATFLGMILMAIYAFYGKFKKDKTLPSQTFYQPTLLMIVLTLAFLVYKGVSSNIKIARNYIENNLLPVRTHSRVSSILNTISKDIAMGPKPAIILLDSWDYAEVSAILLYSGHSLAVWNDIKNTQEFPRIYDDEKKLINEFPDLCKKFSLTKDNLYRFKVEIDRAINISNQLPSLSCNRTTQKIP